MDEPEVGSDLPDEIKARFLDIDGVTYDSRKLHWAVWAVICTWLVHDPDDVKKFDEGYEPDAQPLDDGSAKVRLVNADGNGILCGYFPLSILIA
jgi:hypothetical protein